MVLLTRNRTVPNLTLGEHITISKAYGVTHRWRKKTVNTGDKTIGIENKSYRNNVWLLITTNNCDVTTRIPIITEVNVRCYHIQLSTNPRPVGFVPDTEVDIKIKNGNKIMDVSNNDKIQTRYDGHKQIRDRTTYNLHWSGTDINNCIVSVTCDTKLPDLLHFLSW